MKREIKLRKAANKGEMRKEINRIKVIVVRDGNVVALNEM